MAGGWQDPACEGENGSKDKLTASRCSRSSSRKVCSVFVRPRLTGCTYFKHLLISEEEKCNGMCFFFFFGPCYIQTSSKVNLNTGFVWVLILCFKMIRKTMSCSSPADRCTWPHLPDYFFHLISRFQQILMGRAALTCPSSFTSHSPLCNDTDCDFKHFIPFFIFFLTATNKALLSQQLIKSLQMNKRTYANSSAISHSEKQAFFGMQ